MPNIERVWKRLIYEKNSSMMSFRKNDKNTVFANFFFLNLTDRLYPSIKFRKILMTNKP